MYADNTSITSGNEILRVLENRINVDLASLNEWLKANRLSLNMIKSEYIIIGSAPRLNNFSAEPSLHIGNVKLKRVTCKKTLGVVINQNLGWHDYIDTIAKKVKRGLGVLKRISDFTPFDFLIKVYYAIIQLRLDYCSSVWDNCYKGLKD